MATLLPEAIPAELVLEHLPEPVVVLDSEQRVAWGNAAARALFAGCARGTPLAELDVAATAVAVPGADFSVARLAAHRGAPAALLARAGADSGSLAHEIKNARSAVTLALRAVARALGEDEQAVLEDLAARLQGVEARIREALAASSR